MRRKAVVSLAALAMVIAGCSSSNPSASKPRASATTATTTPTTAIRSGELQVIVGSATGTSPCEKASPTPASPGQVGAGAGGSESERQRRGPDGHGARGMVKQVPLTHAQRVELAAADGAGARRRREVPDRLRSALAGGYDESTPYVPCIGAHYTNIRLAVRFDPSHPSELLYDGTDARLEDRRPQLSRVPPQRSAARLRGPERSLAPAQRQRRSVPARAASSSAARTPHRSECADRGGHKTLLIDIWMMHAWVVPGFECSWGVFSGECPELGGRLGGTAWEAPESSKSCRANPPRADVARKRDRRRTRVGHSGSSVAPPRTIMSDNSRVRVSIVGVVIVALFSTLLARLWFLQIGARGQLEGRRRSSTARA